MNWATTNRLINQAATKAKASRLPLKFSVSSVVNFSHFKEDFMPETVTNIKFTYQDYLLLPGDKRYEIIEGELIMVPAPIPYHQDVSKSLFLLLNNYVESKNLGKIYYAPIDVVLSDENIVQPDILFISKKRFSIIAEKNIQGAPDLVVEIISPSTRERDRLLKRKLYAKFGVREFWLVDGEKKEVEVLTLKGKGFEKTGLYTRNETLLSPFLQGLKISVNEIF